MRGDAFGRDGDPPTSHTRDHITADEETGDDEPEVEAQPPVSRQVRRNLEGANEQVDQLRDGSSRAAGSHDDTEFTDPDGPPPAETDKDSQDGNEKT